MKSMQSKRQSGSVRSPLDDVGLLIQILSHVAGQHLFVSTVCKLWHECNAAVPDSKVTSLIAHPVTDDAYMVWCTPQTTLYSAIFESAPRLRLASQHLAFTSESWMLQRIAGRIASVATLQVALELGLAGKELLRGAAYAGSVTKLDFLETDGRFSKPLEIPDDLCAFAASSGSVEALQWMKERHLLHADVVMAQAAQFGYVHVLDYIYHKSDQLDDFLLADAAKNGHIGAVEWLFEHEAPYDAETICGDAAESGDVQLVQFVQSKGGKINESTIRDAAWCGHLALCQHLHSKGCPWNAVAVAWAASAGHIDVVKWSVEHGCPYDAADVCREAAETGHLPVIQYMLQIETLTAVQLTEVLDAAAAHRHLHVARWLEKQLPRLLI
jgi:hypothetical protein